MKSINWDDQDITFSEIFAAVRSLRKGVGAKGSNIVKLEQEFQNLLGCKHAILVSNCTTALTTSLLALKEVHPHIKKIVVPSFSFIAPANASKFIIDDVELVDCSREDWNVRVEDIPKDADAIMLVDVGGVPCDYDSFKELGLPIIGDSAESLGSTYKGNQIGTQVDLHCFSFQRSKIVTCGEGGLITTNDDRLAEICRSIVSHGYSKDKKSFEYIHDRFGLNFRMCDIEAAILRQQIKKLKKYVKRRNVIAKRYTDKLKGYYKVQIIPDYCTSNYFFYGILTNKLARDRLARYLLDNGIEVKCWTAIHKQELWQKDNLPIATRLSDGVVLLPIHNNISNSDVDYIIKKCIDFWHR